MSRGVDVGVVALGLLMLVWFLVELTLYEEGVLRKLLLLILDLKRCLVVLIVHAQSSNFGAVS